MKTLIKTVAIIMISLLAWMFIWDTLKDGWHKEMERQCIEAQDMCSKYPGACKDVKMYCEGV